MRCIKVSEQVLTVSLVIEISSVAGATESQRRKPLPWRALKGATKVVPFPRRASGDSDIRRSPGGVRCADAGEWRVGERVGQGALDRLRRSRGGGRLRTCPLRRGDGTAAIVIAAGGGVRGNLG